jgi:hypothetical protein
MYTNYSKLRWKLLFVQLNATSFRTAEEIVPFSTCTCSVYDMFKAIYIDVQHIYLFEMVTDFCGQLNHLNTIKGDIWNSDGIWSVFISF